MIKAAIIWLIFSLKRIVKWSRRGGYVSNSKTAPKNNDTISSIRVVKDGDVEKLRKSIGEWLIAYRQKKALSMYRVSKDGNITISQVKAVETADTNYTINILLGYLAGCKLKIDFKE